MRKRWTYSHFNLSWLYFFLVLPIPINAIGNDSLINSPWFLAIIIITFVFDNYTQENIFHL